jgi:DNA-binding transcriptional LysR family regulator
MIGACRTQGIDMLKATLEQLRMFRALADHGSYQQAAEAVFKTPSSVHHAVQKLEEQLGMALFTVHGRQSVLTPKGQVLLRRVRHLLGEADDVQQVAEALSGGVETRLRLAIDQAYPPEHLYAVIDELMHAHPVIRLEFHETVLSGAISMLMQDEADIAIGPEILPGALNEAVGSATFVAVASPDHALFQREVPLKREDLIRARQIVLRDSGSGKRLDSGWLGAEQRWTVNHLGTSIRLVVSGFGFAWLPETAIREHLTAGRLRPLPLDQGRRRDMTFYLNFRNADALGPAAQEFLRAMRLNAQSEETRPVV